MRTARWPMIGQSRPAWWFIRGRAMQSGTRWPHALLARYPELADMMD